MRIPSQVLGALLAADGLLTAALSRDYIRGFWGSFQLGRPYRNFVRSYASFPDTTLRIIGATEVLLGTLLVLPDMRRKEKVEEAEVEESVSKDQFTQLLRGLADSIDKSVEFETTVEGQRVVIPPEAKMKVEFEQEKKGGELELEIKWKGAA